MRENCLYSSEGGERNLPYPYAFSGIERIGHNLIMPLENGESKLIKYAP